MRRIAVLVVVLLTLASATQADAFFMFFSTQVLQTSALVTVQGAPAPRYQVAYIADHLAAETCVMAVTDTETGHFSLTAVPAASCTSRGARR